MDWFASLVNQDEDWNEASRIEVHRRKKEEEEWRMRMLPWEKAEEEVTVEAADVMIEHCQSPDLRKDKWGCVIATYCKYQKPICFSFVCSLNLQSSKILISTFDPSMILNRFSFIYRNCR